MSDLKTVWFGMLTDDSDDSGTDSSIVLIINVRGGRFDVLHRTFPDTEQNDQEQGQANLYEITEDDFEPQPFVGSTVDPQDLNASSIRIGIRRHVAPQECIHLGGTKRWIDRSTCPQYRVARGCGNCGPVGGCGPQHGLW